MRWKDSRAFWLDFGGDRVRRIAYAASFGVDKCPSGLQAELSGRLSRFDALSVREESGVSICQAAGKEAVHVLDPTLLLSKDDYLSLMEDIPGKFSPYMYIYSINISKKEDIRWSELRGFAEREGLSLIVTPASGYLPGRELFEGGISLCYYSGMAFSHPVFRLCGDHLFSWRGFLYLFSQAIHLFSPVRDARQGKQPRIKLAFQTKLVG